MTPLRLRTIIFLILILIGCFPMDLRAESVTQLRYISNILDTLLKIDTNIQSKTYSWKLLTRFIEYRNYNYETVEEATTLVPSVWWIRPTLDITVAYDPYIQKYSLSCEIAAVRMVMQSLWTRRSEESIFNQIPKYPWPMRNGVWWDPDQEFVGYITGSQGWKTWFGIYEFPLLRYLKDEGFTVSRNNNIIDPDMDAQTELTGLLEDLKKWSRVILWWDWCTDREYEDGIFAKWGRHILTYFPLSGKNICTRTSVARVMRWVTPAWKEIRGLSWEHTFLLLWYTGTPENPTHIIVWDTYTGRHIYPTDEWMRKWKLLNYRYLQVSK